MGIAYSARKQMSCDALTQISGSTKTFLLKSPKLTVVQR